jgi:hypothetical protein
MLKSAEVARMLGYEVTESAQTIDEETVVTYQIKFDETHTGADIAEYMKYIEYISKWNGELPQVVTSDSGIMITVPATSSNEN